MFSVGSRGFARASGRLRAFAQDGSKRLKKAQKGAKGLKKALEKAVRACFGAACARAKGRSGAFHVPSRRLRDCSPQVPPGRSKWLFGPALVLPVHSKRLLGLLESDSVPPGRSKWLKKVQKCSKRRKEAQKGARKGCSSLPGAASALEEAVRACFGAACAFEEAVRDCCSRSLFESAGLGYTVL